MIQSNTGDADIIAAIDLAHERLASIKRELARLDRERSSLQAEHDRLAKRLGGPSRKKGTPRSFPYGSIRKATIMGILTFQIGDSVTAEDIRKQMPRINGKKPTVRQVQQAIYPLLRLYPNLLVEHRCGSTTRLAAYHVGDKRAAAAAVA